MRDMHLHQQILDRWVDSLRAIPEVDVVWLEGSLVDEARANPGADIDLRVGIADEAYDRLWEQDRAPMLVGLGDYLILIDWGFIRALTAEEGIIAELACLKTSELEGKELYEWDILHNRLPAGRPAFKKLPLLSAGELWPENEPLTTKDVWRETEITLANMANCLGPFHMQEWHSVRFIISEIRNGIIKNMYRLIELRFAKRYKHFSQVLSAEHLADLDETYEHSVPSQVDPAELAATLGRVFKIKGKYLQLLNDKAGGGFEPTWYWRLYEQTEKKLKRYSA